MTTIISTSTADRWASEVERVADEIGFSGAARVDRGHATELAVAYEMADRRWAIRNTVDTRFGMASVAKGFTALVIASLVEDGTLDWTTTAPSRAPALRPRVLESGLYGFTLLHRWARQAAGSRSMSVTSRRIAWIAASDTNATGDGHGGPLTPALS